MNMKQIYIYQTGEFFSINMEKLSHQTIDEIIHYGLEKFINQKANSLVRKEKARERHMSREEVCKRVLEIAQTIGRGYMAIPHTKTLEEEVTAKLLALTDKEKEVYRKLLAE